MTDVSVVIPVYGVEKYLQECIDSLLQQTLQTCEFIFVNDASPDGCLDILLKNQSLYPDKIRVIDSKINLRQGGARNLGVEAAKGKYIGFVDSDDFILPDMYETLYIEAEKICADAVYIQHASVPDVESYYTFGGGAVPRIVWDETLTKLHNTELNDSNMTDFMRCPIGGVWCGLYKRSVLLNSGVRFPEHLRYEDNYWGSLIRPYFHRVGFVEKVCYLYRQNPESTVHQRNQSYQLTDRIQIEHMVLSEARKRGFLNRFHDVYEWTYTRRYALNTFAGHIIKNDEINYKALREIMLDLRKEFPKWYKNPYFKKSTGVMKRIFFFCVIYAPVMTAWLYPTWKKISDWAKTGTR